MKVSIVTVCYNSEQTIEDSILSVINQRYDDIEYIIVDGKSNDRTLDIVNQYKSSITRIVSETDQGIYDAMNKGLALSTGEVVAFLNSDDIYQDDQVIASVVEAMESKKVDCLYGDIVYVDRNQIDRVKRHWVTGEQNDFGTGWHPAHPAFFLKRHNYLELGDYRIEMNIAADFELMMRMLQKHQVRSLYFPEILVRMRLGGASNKSIKNILQGYKDIKKAFNVNQISMPVIYPFYRYLPKIKEFFR